MMEMNIRWAEVFILVYSVIDKVSFDDIHRLKFLIRFYKRRKKIYNYESYECPVILVANKCDLYGRMVTKEEGIKMSREIGCASFHEISASENIEEVAAVFHDTYRFWKSFSLVPKLSRSKSDSLRVNLSCSDKTVDKKITSSNCNVADLKISNKNNDAFDNAPDEPFRSRAKTDGNLIMKKWKLHSNLLSPEEESSNNTAGNLQQRRNSISLRGRMLSFNETDSISEDISEDDVY